MKCLNPKKTENGTFRCGRCLACRCQKVNEYIIRFNAQNKVSLSSFFLTLTYTDEELPLVGVCKSDIQTFILKLKEKVNEIPEFEYYGKVTFKYVVIAEYGGRFSRPHYHLNIWFENAQLEWSDMFWCVSECWKRGRIDLQLIDDRQSNYIAKYHATNVLSEGIMRLFNTPFYVNSAQYSAIQEKLEKEKTPIAYELALGKIVTIYPQSRFIRQNHVFRLSSHGIGESWLQSDEFKNCISNNDYKIVNNNKQKCFIPRYYIRKMSNELQSKCRINLIDYMLSRPDDDVDRRVKELESIGLEHQSAYKIALSEIGRQWRDNYYKNVILRKSHGNENIDF